MKKKIYIIPIVFMMILVIGACGTVKSNEVKRQEAIANLKYGMDEAQVRTMVGEPDFEETVKPGYLVLYYNTDEQHKENKTKETCTPISFENGKVAAINKDLIPVWRKKASKQDAMAKASAQAAQKEEQERLLKIKELEAIVKPIPASKAKLNLKYYKELLDLDPNNTRYQKKVSHYQAAVDATMAKNEQGNSDQEEQTTVVHDRRLNNKMLRKYEGNDKAEMALHDMGEGTYYVWLKNVGSNPFDVKPEYFVIIDKQGREITYKSCKGLDQLLDQGGVAHGKITFEVENGPQKLTFTNPVVGTIAKEFP